MAPHGTHPQLHCSRDLATQLHGSIGDLATQLHGSTGDLATQLHSKIAKKQKHSKISKCTKLAHRYTYLHGDPNKQPLSRVALYMGLQETPTVKAAVRDGLGWRHTSAFGLGGGLAGWDGAIHVRLA